MEVILREHVDNLGRRGDVVKVAAGYARNYLLPRKLALAVNEDNKRQIEREQKLAEARELEEKSQAEAFAAAARAGRHRDRPPRRRERHAVRLGHVGRHRAGAAGQGLRDRQAQDHAGGSAQGARRVHRAGQDPPRRHRAGQGQGRRRAEEIDRSPNATVRILCRPDFRPDISATLRRRAFGRAFSFPAALPWLTSLHRNARFRTISRRRNPCSARS